jgi:hypothetical protein
MAGFMQSFQPRTRGGATSNAERQRDFRRAYPHYNRLVKAWQRGDLAGLLPDYLSSQQEEAAVRALFRSPQAVEVVEVLQARLLLPPAQRRALPAPAKTYALPAPAETAAADKPQLALPAPAESIVMPGMNAISLIAAKISG